MNGLKQQISVVDPISPAIEKVKTVLFRPFDLKKWFVIGFCAWLAMLGQAGGGGGGGGAGNYNYGTGGDSSGFDLKEFFAKSKQWILDNLDWLIPVAIAGVVLIIGLWVLFLWLSSRGRFMFLHCVSRNVAEVAVPWQSYAKHGQSLFLFRICVGLLAGILFLALFAIAGLVIVPPILAQGFSSTSIIAIVVSALLGIGLAIAFGVVGKLTQDFIVPIMYLRTPRCLTAWEEFKGLVATHFGSMILYLLFQIVIKMAVGLITIIAILITCCLAGCLLAIPYLGTVLFLPILVFERSYSLIFLAQFGSNYDAFKDFPNLETGTPPPPLA